MKFQKPWVIAHRGFSHLYHENTIEAFDAAIKVGVDGIELDIQMTYDGVPVIYHDRSLHKAGGGLRRVRNQPWSRLEALNLPTLDVVLERYGPHCRLLLEIKRREKNRDRFEALMKVVIDKVCALGLQEKTMILCYDFDLLQYGFQLNPHLNYVWNLDQPDYRKDTDFLYAYSVNVKGLTPEFADWIQNLDKPLLAFTCDSQKKIDKALACKARGIMANNVKWLSERIEALNGLDA